ncbi:MAG TPA: hypothetical protein VLD38_07130, partial [Nitrosopumilaceae archaeon]|nr:hypothetical protein [Nitrosopumilaceae archaeon]
QTTTNHAFATADICIDLDCTSDVGTHTGDPQVQGSDESERDEVTVTIVNPHTTLTKSANVTSGTSPLPVRYTYSEVNDGDTSFKNLVLTDDPVCAPQVGPVKTGGDQDSFLDPGETWTWTCDTTLTQTTTNTAFITAEICSDDTCTASLGTHSGNPSGGNAPTEHDSETVTIFATTRTIGYWQTHLTQFKAYWPDTAGDPGTINCDDFDVGTDAQALGGMYASIPKNTDKSQRSDLDQARMRLAQQLVGAILNNLAFGSVPGGSISIDDAKAAFCSDNIGDINAAQSAMGAFNSSGDAIPFPPGFVNSNATPQAAKAFANVAFWDFLDTKII